MAGENIYNTFCKNCTQNTVECSVFYYKTDGHKKKLYKPMCSVLLT